MITICWVKSVIDLWSIFIEKVLVIVNSVEAKFIISVKGSINIENSK